MTKTLLSLATALLFGTAAQAVTYTTQIFGAVVGDVPISRIEINWSTNVAFGNAVTVSDLSDLSFSIYGSGSTPLHTDNAIVGGSVQSIGGIARSLDDLIFSALSGQSVLELDNDFSQLQFFQHASGSTFNLYGDGAILNVAAYIDGELQGEDSTFMVLSQNTTVSAIPEPATYAAFAGLLALGCVMVRRKSVRT